MRSLLVTKLVPLPANEGGKQRTLAIARRLAEHGPVTICGFDDGTADVASLRREGIAVEAVPWRPTSARTLRGLLRSPTLSSARFWSPELAARVRQVAARAPVDLLQVEYLQMVPVARGVPARYRVVDLHNVESALVRSYAEARRGPVAAVARAEAGLLARRERADLGGFDLVTVVSTRERRRLPDGLPHVLVCPNGWDPSPAALPAASEPAVAFVAAMGWAPNVDGARWFAGRVWPRVLARRPEARLLLVGRDPAPAVRALASGTVEVSGAVPAVAPYLQRALLSVAPLRAGGGTRLKILESLDAARPVVATTVAVDGLEDLVGRGVVVADDEGGFAEAVVGLLEDPDGTRRLGSVGRQVVARCHAWDTTLRPLLQAVAP